MMRTHDAQEAPNAYSSSRLLLLIHAELIKFCYIFERCMICGNSLFIEQLIHVFGRLGNLITRGGL